MRILLAQINSITGDLAGNTRSILHSIELAREKQADLVLFSELVLCGYPAEDFLLHADFLAAINTHLETVIKATKGIAVILGLPRCHERQGEKKLFNSAAVIDDQTLLGFQDKILLPTYDVFDEKRYFEPGDATMIWTIKNSSFAINICEDIWQHSGTLRYTHYLRDPILEVAAKKPQFLLNLSASPFSTSKNARRQLACSKAALTLDCPVILCNQVGGNDSIIFDGHSVVMGPDGRLRQEAKGFEEDHLFIDTAQLKDPLQQKPDRTKELYHALVLGVRDYFHKQGFCKACLGLSGGVDSALVACIAVKALGRDNVLGVLMPSRFSSSGSVDDAVQLAKNLGIAYKKIPIEAPFQSLLALLGPEFDNHPVDVTEENIQARIRGIILMALSNKLGHLVLCTANKSEMAMGYSTLYGDMCGSLAVINDVTKGDVYALSKWINQEAEIIPWKTIAKPPSAELKHDQKDSDTLPDYAIIDLVIQDYLEEHLSSAQIAEQRKLPLELVDSLIKRIHRSEYKRRQGPPGLRVTEKSFSIGRSFPIAQRFM